MFLTKPASSAARNMTRLFAYFNKTIQEHVPYTFVYYLNNTELSTKINVARATKKLEGMGFLFKDETKGYYLSDPLLKLWILKNL